MRHALSPVILRLSKDRFIRSLGATGNPSAEHTASTAESQRICSSCHLRTPDSTIHVHLLYFAPNILASITNSDIEPKTQATDTDQSGISHLLDLPYDVILYLVENHLSPIHRPNLAITCKAAAKICVENGWLHYDLPLLPELLPKRRSFSNIPSSHLQKQSELVKNQSNAKVNLTDQELAQLRRKARLAYTGTLAGLEGSSDNMLFAIYINRKRIVSELTREEKERRYNNDKPAVWPHQQTKQYFWHKANAEAGNVDHESACEMALNKNTKLMREITSLALWDVGAADTIGVRDLVWCTGLEVCELVGTRGGGYRIKQEYRNASKGGLDSQSDLGVLIPA